MPSWCCGLLSSRKANRPALTTALVATATPPPAWDGSPHVAPASGIPCDYRFVVACRIHSGYCRYAGRTRPLHWSASDAALLESWRTPPHRPQIAEAIGAQPDQTTSRTSPLLVLSVAPCAAYSPTGELSSRVRVRLTSCDLLYACRDRQTYQRSIEKHHEPIRAPVSPRVPGQGH